MRWRACERSCRPCSQGRLRLLEDPPPASRPRPTLPPRVTGVLGLPPLPPFGLGPATGAPPGGWAVGPGAGAAADGGLAAFHAFGAGAEVAGPISASQAQGSGGPMAPAAAPAAAAPSGAAVRAVRERGELEALAGTSGTDPWWGQKFWQRLHQRD